MYWHRYSSRRGTCCRITVWFRWMTRPSPPKGTHISCHFTRLSFSPRLISLGLRYRASGQMRTAGLCCLTLIPLIDPVIGRVMFFYFPSLPHPLLYQGVTFSLATIAAAALVFSYKGPTAPRRALFGYFVLLVTLEVAWFTLARTDTWVNAVAWFRSLPLT